jgi:hypothetical protein
MLSVRGVYENGEVKIKEKVSITRETPVIITFLEDLPEEGTKKMDLSEFSFNRSKDILKDYKGSLSDTVIEERRSFL